MQVDFMKMPFPDNNFDAVYAIEATCHAPDAVGGCFHLKIGTIQALFGYGFSDSFLSLVKKENH